MSNGNVGYKPSSLHSDQTPPLLVVASSEHSDQTPALLVVASCEHSDQTPPLLVVASYEHSDQAPPLLVVASSQCIFWLIFWSAGGLNSFEMEGVW